jgi:hypothetical protein
LFLAAVGLVVACEDDPVSPATTGSIALEFVIPSESGGSAGPATAGPANGAGESSSAPVLKKATFDAARATAIGPETVSINLTLIGANWQGTIGDLTPGSYRVIVEGFEGGIVDWYGEASSVSVSAGQTSTATVTFDTFVPDFDPVQTPTTSTTVTVNFQSVGYAASYTVEWDTDPGFGGPQTISGITGTSVNIDVPGPGVYYVRIQAVNSQVSSGGVWSDVVSFEVVGTSFAGFLSLPGGGFGRVRADRRRGAVLRRPEPGFHRDRHSRPDPGVAHDRGGRPGSGRRDADPELPHHVAVHAQHQSAQRSRHHGRTVPDGGVHQPVRWQS